MDQVILKVHRTPNQCIFDVPAPTIIKSPKLTVPPKETNDVKDWKILTTTTVAEAGDQEKTQSESFADQLPFPFWVTNDKGEQGRVDFTISGEVLGASGSSSVRECQVNVDGKIGLQRLQTSIKSSTPLLGVGRESSLSPGNMTMFVLTPKGQLETKIFPSDRTEVLATKYQTVPTVNSDDAWEKDTADFFNAPMQPRLTRWEKFRKRFPSDKAQDRFDWIEEHRRGIRIFVILILLGVVGRLMWKIYRPTGVRQVQE